VSKQRDIETKANNIANLDHQITRMEQQLAELQEAVAAERLLREKEQRKAERLLREAAEADTKQSQPKSLIDYLEAYHDFSPALEAQRSGKASSRGGKPKVPRPVNAFILFRKDRHPALKKDNPTLHNNDISIILGKEWKNTPEDVKGAYKARAERIKQQHALDNPGYQYAPRKPGEKKRRMTKKKLARMRSANSINDIADLVRTDTEGVLPSDLDSEDEMPEPKTKRSAPTAEDLISSRRSQNAGQLGHNRLGNMQLVLPSNNANLFGEVQDYQNQHGANATTPFNSGTAAQVLTSVPQYSQNDDAFFNSLVDWQGIANDASLLKDASPEVLAELAELELGSGFDFSAETSPTAFDEEIARTMGFF
jgi:hypothetical protein